MTRITFNAAGFDELLTSTAATALVKGKADELAAAANRVASTTSPPPTHPYYEVEDGSDGHRARFRVHTDGPRAAAHEAKTNALQRNL